jgi:hypothetical protein
MGSGPWQRLDQQSQHLDTRGDEPAKRMSDRKTRCRIVRLSGSRNRKSKKQGLQRARGSAIREWARTNGKNNPCSSYQQHANDSDGKDSKVLGAASVGIGIGIAISPAHAGHRRFA